MAWTRVQTFAATAQYSAATANNTAIALSSAVAVGDVILAFTTAGNDVSAAGSTMTDSLGGNTYNRITAAQGGQFYISADDQSFDAWYCIVATAGTPTITYDPDTTLRPWLAMKGSHFTGSSSSSTRRASAGHKDAAAPGTGADAISSGSVAASSGDLLWAGSGSAAATAAVSGTGFTTGTRNATTGLIDEWKTASGAGAGTFTDSTNGGTSLYATIAIAITPAAAAASNPPFDLAHAPHWQGLIAQ